MHHIFLFTALLLSISVKSQNGTNGCENYKTGNFYVINNQDTCFIERRKNLQIEKCNNSDMSYEFIVIWLNDTKYILRDREFNPTNAKRVMRKDIVMSIIEEGDEFHVVHMKSKETKNREFKVYCNKASR